MSTSNSAEWLIQLGVRFGVNGPHTDRTMILNDLRMLLDNTELNAQRPVYFNQVIDANVLGKITKKARELTLSSVSAVYGFIQDNAIFLAFFRFWAANTDGQPLLAGAAECAGKRPNVWLRDKFFAQHAKRLHRRPLTTHVWDGLKDSFFALMHYHKPDARNLERLMHTYLGNWIRLKGASARSGIDVTSTRLAALEDPKRRLELILEDESPFDIFLHWKMLSGHPIGLNPELNNGVRLNIRPLVTTEAMRYNNRPKLNITQDKDRRKDEARAAGFHKLIGDRIKDHMTRAEKVFPRAKTGGG